MTKRPLTPGLGVASAFKALAPGDELVMHTGGGRNHLAEIIAGVLDAHGWMVPGHGYSEDMRVYTITRSGKKWEAQGASRG